MEAVALAGLVILIGLLAAYWGRLPERVPIHFGVSGVPDRWGGRGTAFIIPVVGLLLYVQLTAVARYSQYLNLPFSIDRDHPEVVKVLASLMATLKAIVVVTFAYIQWAMINTALGGVHGLGRAFLPLSLGSVILVLAVFTLKLRRYQKAGS